MYRSNLLKLDLLPQAPCHPITLLPQFTATQTTSATPYNHFFVPMPRFAVPYGFLLSPIVFPLF